LEYTNLQYFLFKIGNLLNSAIFAILVAVILATAIVVYFFAQASHDNPKLSESKLKKIKTCQKISLFIFGMLIVILFIGRYFSDGIDDPNTVINDKETRVIAKGKVLKVNHRKGTMIILPNGKKSSGNVIKITPNESHVMLGTPNMKKYDGTHIFKNQLNKIDVGDYVKIQNHQYIFKYKNHSKFSEDKKTEKQVKQINDYDVNGEVVKTKSNPYKYSYIYGLNS